MRPILATLTCLSLSLGCAALREDLGRAEATYERAEYERTLVWLDDLEREVPDMEPELRARFYYLRGMTAYRLGQRTDALYYLALAREVAGERGVGLREQWRATLATTLEELTPTTATHFARETSGGEVTETAETADDADETPGEP